MHTISGYYVDNYLHRAWPRRSDQERSTAWLSLEVEEEERVFAPLLEDEILASDAHRWRRFLTTTFGAFFDYMVEHPHVMRMFNWEQAEGWQTFAKIASQFEPADLVRLEALFSRARRAGLLRPDLDVVVMLVLVEQICWSSPTTLPLYQSLLAGRDFSSTTALAYVREQIIAFLVAGIMSDAGERN